MGAAEWVTNKTVNSDGYGNCPRWVRCLVRFILWAMWLHHDLVHSRIFGRGDGLDENNDLNRSREKYEAIYLI